MNLSSKLFGLNIKPRPWNKPISGSDNASFARQDIPIMWFHTEGHPSYHLPDDTVEKIDIQKYEAIIKTSFLTLWKLANE
ncbi:M28 family peptidase [Carboxylicivirga sp. N1Y90]|uniref:M28 family peptidase n=1 Tax=Carboxylicivirga fragile TaxID=3417571 RepID=UPI003D33C041|nr:M28 family peptidase [Marinilabiliaceae bacterium N1Y90]